MSSSSCDGSTLTFREMRDKATDAVKFAAARAGVDFFDLLDRNDDKCTGARWSVWLALINLGWSPAIVGRLFYVDRKTILTVQRLATHEMHGHATVIESALRGVA